jgi:Polycystin cation channel.
MQSPKSIDHSCCKRFKVYFDKETCVISLNSPLCISDTCIIHDEFKKYIQECNDKYSATAEDTKWYKRGWTNPIKKGGKQKKRFSPWKYANGFESRNIVPVMATLNTYMGGGYLGELGINEKFSLMYEQYMKKYNWVDKHTRAVFLEFTLYNPNLNLISVGELMFEFFNFGGVIPRAEIYVSRMYRNLVPEHKIFLGFDIVFFIYTLYCLFRECRKMKRTKSQYFKSLNNITNFVLTFFGLGVMGIYAIRSLSLGSKIAEFLESPHLFISFYQNAMYHEMVAMLMSLIDFIAIIKFLTFLQFNRNFLTLIQTVVRAAPKLAIFCSYISLWVMAFVVFSFLLFGAERFNFHSLQRSIYSLNLLLLGVFDWNDFISRPYIGPILFVVYCIIMTFMLMNIFMTILMEFYAVVQADEELKKREFHLVQYLMESFMLSMGLKKPLGLGEDEVKWRKKDPFIHRINRLQRSIEEKKTAKMNKMINKLYADDIIEDVEMVSLELMRYPDEFFDLIPCSVKLKLQAMLRRGEIDYETYCEFLEISMAQEESASIRSRGSLASQKTLNLVPDIEDQDSFTADIVTNERFAEPDPDLQAELEYLKQYQNEQFTPRGTATISDLNLQIHEGYINEEDQETEDSIQKQQQHQVEQASQQLQDLQDIGNSLADFNDNSSKNDSNAHSILANKQHNDAIGEEPTHNDDNNVRDSAANSDYKHMTQSRDRPHTDTVDTRPSPTTNPQRFSPQTSINIDLNASNVSSITLQDSQNLDSTRNLLGESANGGNLVVASRRKNKKKRKTTSNA